MKCLVVIAHPLSDSLCQSLAETVVSHLSSLGNIVVVEDLYRSNFNPVLSPPERASYYSSKFNSSELTSQIDNLLSAQSLILIFPTWWFGFPAILKGWFDRVWAPGIAYDHASNFGPIKPRLSNIQYTLAITTLGSPWWVDTLIMRNPVRRILKIAILGACARSSKFEMLSLYKAESLTSAQVQSFQSKIKRLLSRWR